MPKQNFDETYARVPAEQKRLLLEFRANHPYSTVDVNGSPWRYIASGRGDRTLLFLPGGFLTADMWFYPILALEQQYRILAPDAYALQDIWGEDVSTALLRTLDAEGVERATVIGLSAGGGVAQYFVQEHPERVQHLVFSHCGVIEHSPETEKQLRKTLRLVRLAPLFLIRKVLLRMTAGHLAPSSTWIEFHNAFFQEAGPRLHKGMVLNFLQEGIDIRRRFVFEPQVLESWPGKILILASGDDEMAIRSLKKLQGRYPRARTHVFKEGGHHTFMLFPEAYTAALNVFLDEVGS